MNFPLAIDANKAILLRIVAGLVAMLGGLSVKTVRRHIHLYALAILRPTESATRRLIAILAHEISVPIRRARNALKAGIPKGKGTRIPAFGLFDKRKNVDPKTKRVPGYGPSVRGFDDEEYFPPPKSTPHSDDLVNAGPLMRRLLALQQALGDLPRQARRLARMLGSGKAKWPRAMRPGRPPGHRAKGSHPVDEVLADCHELALMALNEPPERTPP